jgi:L-threonylcarbamoyladenylate synthase
MKIVDPTSENIALAAKHLRAGKLIGMPTETVYGIAANALNANAVKATFAVKGRPVENPMIVHIANMSQLREVARDISDRALELAGEFWPGPLTLVLPKTDAVPAEVTAGLDTVAVRMPDHPVAAALIAAAGVPVSAPSANKFMGLSPTTARMIEPEIGKCLELILDGGACGIGIESTVLDLTSSEPRILRPGGVSREEIEAVLGISVLVGGEGTRKSPGMYPRHYAPKTPVAIVERLKPGQKGLTLESGPEPGQVRMLKDPAGYAHDLYRALSDMDEKSLEVIYVQAPPKTEEWEAVWDRLKKIATPS